ncbi:hypothetical protein AM1H77_08660 [Apilactobacillus micheneri]|nr:hypothetical protein NBRC113063_00751 [Apilactobacillus micheneri]
MKTNWKVFWLGIILIVLPGFIFISINNIIFNSNIFILCLIFGYYIVICLGSKLMSKYNLLIKEFYDYLFNNKNSLTYRKSIILLPMMFLIFLPIILLFFWDFVSESWFIETYMFLYFILLTFVSTTKFNFEK